MSSTDDISEFDKAVSGIVVAFLERNPISAAELPDLVRRVRAAMREAPGANPAAQVASPTTAERPEDAPLETPTANDETLRPAVPVEDSVRWEYLVSLEDGKHYRSLRRHLMSRYGMTPDDYRRKWGLPADYPMVAPSYAQERSNVAKRIGLGRSPAKAGAAPPRRPSSREKRANGHPSKS